MAPPYLGSFVRVADLPSRRALYGQQAPVAWWSRPSSVPQSMAGPFRFLDRGCGTSCPPPEDVATAGAVTASVAASTEGTPLGEIISGYSDDLTSLSTSSVVIVVVLAT